MTTRRPHVPGGRKIRHVVLASAEEDALLRAKAKKQGMTVSRLLVGAALNASGKNRTLLLQEVAALRRDVARLQQEDQLRFEEAVNRMWANDHQDRC
jgi:hypothetical protein